MTPTGGPFVGHDLGVGVPNGGGEGGTGAGEQQENEGFFHGEILSPPPWVTTDKPGWPRVGNYVAARIPEAWGPVYRLPQAGFTFILMSFYLNGF